MYVKFDKGRIMYLIREMSAQNFYAKNILCISRDKIALRKIKPVLRNPIDIRGELLERIGATCARAGSGN